MNRYRPSVQGGAFRDRMRARVAAVRFLWMYERATPERREQALDVLRRGGASVTGTREPAAPAVPVVHDTTHGVRSHWDGSPGGVWYAGCSCGWTNTGTYALDDDAEAASDLGLLYAAQHRHETLDGGGSA